MSLPTADDLFRPTAARGPDQSEQPTDADQAPRPAVVPAARLAPPPDVQPEVQPAEVSEDEDTAGRRSSGRVRHDEKMTVYVTADELLDLEHARLSLRREHGLAVDRGRLVREAIAMALADLDLGGEESTLVQRLTAS